MIQTYTINKTGIVQGVAVRPTNNKGGEIKPRLIIVHDTAGNIDANSSIEWLCNPQAKASAHFVIDRDGKITQLVACHIKAWHAGKSVYRGTQNVNDFSIGIEHVNPGKMLAGGKSSFGKVFDTTKYAIQHASTPHHGDGYWMSYTEAQLDASMSLILALRDRYDIDEIAPHWEISPGRKVDCNPLFPLAQFRGRIEGRQDSNNFTIQAKPGAIFRQWPSFNSGNRISQVDDDGWFLPIKSGVFEITGTPAEFPESLVPGSAPQLWYNVTMQAKDQPDTAAWVWSGHVKESRA